MKQDLEGKVGKMKFPMGRRVGMYLASAIMGVASLGANSCCDPEDCSKLNATATNRYYVGVTYNATEEQYECPDGCTKIGETEDKYCCDCPE